ncbi:mCG146964 [Mus musculus]|nr:mCG146964 [Mus musculus]
MPLSTQSNLQLILKSLLSHHSSVGKSPRPERSRLLAAVDRETCTQAKDHWNPKSTWRAGEMVYRSRSPLLLQRNQLQYLACTWQLTTVGTSRQFQGI